MAIYSQAHFETEYIAYVQSATGLSRSTMRDARNGSKYHEMQKLQKKNVRARKLENFGGLHGATQTKCLVNLREMWNTIDSIEANCIAKCHCL